MRATGIVRRFDDLGRIVIPKEIRRSLRLKDGDAMEIFTNRDGEVVLKKYSPVGLDQFFMENCVHKLAKTLNCSVCICDRDTVIAAAGSRKRQLLNHSITEEMNDFIINQKTYWSYVSFMAVTQADSSYPYQGQIMTSIVSDGEPIGALVLLNDSTSEHFNDTTFEMAQAIAAIIAEQLS